MTDQAELAVALNKLLSLPPEEKIVRFDEMVLSTFSHLDGRDLLKELHPRKMLDIKRRIDAVETWFQGDWLSTLMQARDGEIISLWHKVPTLEAARRKE